MYLHHVACVVPDTEVPVKIQALVSRGELEGEGEREKIRDERENKRYERKGEKQRKNRGRVFRPGGGGNAARLLRTGGNNLP